MKMYKGVSMAPTHHSRSPKEWFPYAPKKGHFRFRQKKNDSFYSRFRCTSTYCIIEQNTEKIDENSIEKHVRTWRVIKKGQRHQA